MNFINNSTKSVYVDLFTQVYPDTVSFRHYGGLVSQSQIHKTEVGEENDSFSKIRSCYENRFNNTNPAKDTVMIWVFDANVLETTPWETVWKNYMVLQRYDMSLQDLQNLDWQISYPPSKKMKNIKMYPAYTE